jgi:hypothetical protein
MTVRLEKQVPGRNAARHPVKLQNRPAIAGWRGVCERKRRAKGFVRLNRLSDLFLFINLLQIEIAG